VLVVATAWPQELDVDLDPSPFARWVAATSSTHLERIDLSPLSTEDAMALAVDDLRPLITDSPVAAPEQVASRIVRRVGTNPLGVRAFLRLDEVHNALSAGDLTDHDLAMLPTGLRQILEDYWKDLPPDVRQVLERGAHLGATYVPAVVIAAAIADGITTAAAAAPQAIDPYSWVRPLSEDLTDLLHTFVDPLLHECAKSEAQRLRPTHLEHLHQQVIAAAIAAALSDQQPDWRSPGLTDGVGVVIMPRLRSRSRWG